MYALTRVGVSAKYEQVSSSYRTSLELVLLSPQSCRAVLDDDRTDEPVQEKNFNAR